MCTGAMGESASENGFIFSAILYNLPLHVVLCGNAIVIFINSIASHRTATQRPGRVGGRAGVGASERALRHECRHRGARNK